ncbi:HMCN1 [Symbiodinium sp. CCMP2592]|nr:HMCN1 [Symbiodinium sp. CCMP2592]
MDCEEYWDHAVKFDFDPPSLWDHTYRMFDTLCSTKEPLEDVFGSLASEFADESNQSQITLPRVFFLSSLLPRWETEEFPPVRLHLQDLQNREVRKRKKKDGLTSQLDRQRDGDGDSRPAGHLSQFRSVASMAALRKYAASSFENMAGLWAGQLFLPGHLYHDRGNGA